MARVTLRDVRKSFGEITALKDISIDIGDGEFFAILGPSGAGKTTFLKVVAGLEIPEQGEILFDNETINDVPPAKRDVAMTFENYSLFPHYTVYKNLSNPLRSPLRREKLSSEKVSRRVHDIARMLNIDELMERLPAELSGGQQQRVSLGRAIIRQPRVLLLDEPLAHVDAKIRNQLRTEFHLLREKMSTTVIYTTHDYREAISLGDRIAVLDKGVIQQVGGPEEVYYAPVNIDVAMCVGWPGMNLFHCTVNQETRELHCKEAGFTASLSNEIFNTVEGSKRRELIVGARPGKIRFSREESGRFFIRAVTEIVEPLNNQAVIYTRAGNMEITLLDDNPDMLLKHREEIWLDFNMDSFCYFDPETKRNLSCVA
jgi:ABC-type sugar transport system ATPase subunit